MYKRQAWWNKRKTSEHAWKVPVEEIVARNYNLDCKNPHVIEVNHRDPEELMADYQKIVAQLQAAQQALKSELIACLGDSDE